MMGYRKRHLATLAERARLDAWLLAIRADEPVPFWPLDHPFSLEGIPTEALERYPGPL